VLKKSKGEKKKKKKKKKKANWIGRICVELPSKTRH
jgi:hypothetical protein